MKLLLVVTVSLALTACQTNPPTPFKTGAQTEAPVGCKDGKERGVKC